MKDLKIVFMGTPDFSVGIMEAILQAGGNIVACVTVADKPAGRGKQLHESAVKKFAVSNGIPVLQPLKMKDEAFLDELRSYQADVFVVVAFRMLPAEVWKMPARGTFNLHASLLPDYRGAAPINRAVMNGDTETGVSTFFIDEQIDTGNVIGQTRMTIGPNETAGELHDRMIISGGQLVVKTLQQIASGNVQPIPQSELTESQQRPAPKLFRETTLIDWNATAEAIHNHIRGLSPYPAAWTIFEDKAGNRKQVKILRSELIETGEGTFSPVLTNKNGIYIQCRNGKLSVLEWQFEGKRKMTAAEWLVGNNADDWQIVSNSSS